MQFTEILNRYRIPRAPDSHHHVTTGFVQIDCPFCSKGSERWRMGYSLAGRFFTCWKCGSHRLLETLSELTGEPFRVCRRWLDDLPIEQTRKEILEGKLVIPKGVGPLLPIHRKYLKGRKFDPEELQALWGIKGIGQAGRLAWRLWLPLASNGEICSWSTRSVSRGKIRYINARPEEERWPAKTMLMGLDYVRHAIVVHEGWFDAYRTGPGAVATMGLVVTKDQVLAISRIPIRVICFDNEDQAQLRAEKLCRQLEVFPGSTYRIRIDSHDPGEATATETKRLRAFLK